MFNNFSFFSLFLLILSIYFLYFFIFNKSKLIKNNSFSYNFRYKFSPKIKLIFLSLSLFFLIFSLFEPRFSLIKTNNTSNLNIMFVLDVSRSMNILDYEKDGELYSRLDFSKETISDYILKEPGNSYGLSIFGPGFKNLIPLTRDYGGFLTILSGTNYENLQPKNYDLFDEIKAVFNHYNFLEERIVIVFSDGNFDYNKSFSSFDRFNDVLVLGIGKTGNNIVPDTINDGKIKSYIEQNGQKSSFPIKKEGLTDLSNFLGGEYFYGSEKGVNSTKIDTFIEESSSKSYNPQKNYSYFYIIIAFIFFILSLFLLYFEKSKK